MTSLTWLFVTSNDPVWPHYDPIMAEKIIEYWFYEKIGTRNFFRQIENFQMAAIFLYT